MTLLGAETITGTPQSVTTSEGKRTLVPGTPYTFRGTVIPVGQHVLERLPEGARQSATWQIFVEGTAPTPRIETPADRLSCSKGTLVVVGEVDLTVHTGGLPHVALVCKEVSADE